MIIKEPRGSEEDIKTPVSVQESDSNDKFAPWVVLVATCLVIFLMFAVAPTMHGYTLLLFIPVSVAIIFYKFYPKLEIFSAISLSVLLCVGIGLAYIIISSFWK